MCLLSIKGDSYPTLTASNALHLLSMRFCPYAQRIHLVLDVKAIPYDTININLKDKPNWLTKYSPLGKVPALGLTNEPNTPYLYESLMVADYLDEKYPQPALYPLDPLAKAEDRLLIARFEPVIGPYFRIALNARSNDEALQKLLENLSVFETELTKRGSTFFGGANVGMVDLMIWPWCERITALKDIVEPEVAEQYALRSDLFPKLVRVLILRMCELSCNWRYFFIDSYRFNGGSQ